MSRGWHLSCGHDQKKVEKSIPGGEEARGLPGSCGWHVRHRKGTVWSNEVDRWVQEELGRPWNGTYRSVSFFQERVQLESDNTQAGFKRDPAA